MKHVETLMDYKTLDISSEAFQKAGSIPKKYTCDGENISPPLEIQNIPETARSLVLIMEDPDAPYGSWLHWLIWNIAPCHHINEGEVLGEQGINDFGSVGYRGPCPPFGTHHYLFKIYALDDLLRLQEGSTRLELEEEMAGHLIAYGEYMGTYTRKIK